MICPNNSHCKIVNGLKRCTMFISYKYFCLFIHVSTCDVDVGKQHTPFCSSLAHPPILTFSYCFPHSFAIYNNYTWFDLQSSVCNPGNKETKVKVCFLMSIGVDFAMAMLTANPEVWTLFITFFVCYFLCLHLSIFATIHSFCFMTLFILMTYDRELKPKNHHSLCTQHFL